MKNQISQRVISVLLALINQYAFADMQNSDPLSGDKLMNLNQPVSHRLKQQINARLQYDMNTPSKQNVATRLAAPHNEENGFIRHSLLPSLAAK